MFLIISLVFLSMFLFVNTLYYTLSLLFIVVSLLYMLVSNFILHSLTMIMFSIVYIGAIIILIGYICAICPNLILSPTSFSFGLFLVFLLVPTLLSPLFTSNSNVSFVPMVEYFYTSSGVVAFFTLIFMLFLTLLIVTSQYLTPNGPFRSVKI